MLELPNKISLPFIICERRCFRSLFEFICLWKCFFASIIICLKWFFFFLGSLFKERGLRSNRIIPLCGSVSLFFSVFFFFLLFVCEIFHKHIIVFTINFMRDSVSTIRKQFEWRTIFCFCVFVCVCVFFFFFFLNEEQFESNLSSGNLSKEVSL